jgi:hypothetical protein
MSANDFPSSVSSLVMDWVFDETGDVMITFLSGIFSYAGAFYVKAELDKRLR